jgi:hypothetical protein
MNLIRITLTVSDDQFVELQADEFPVVQETPKLFHLPCNRTVAKKNLHRVEANYARPEHGELKWTVWTTPERKGVAYEDLKGYFLRYINKIANRLERLRQAALSIRMEALWANSSKCGSRNTL